MRRSALPRTLQRLRAMDGAEIRFRATTSIRTTVARARAAVSRPRWNRQDLRLRGPEMRPIRALLARQDWMAAHVALAHHFQSRTSRFPLGPSESSRVASVVSRRFSPLDTAVADRVLAGRYALLGYRDVDAGVLPDWHRDPVHDRVAPLLFWDDVAYLDPTHGDHKVTWELNRHQHWLALGRASRLTGDHRYYDLFVSQLEGWMQANPPLQGTNWASMLELAFRSLSWIWALHLFIDRASERDQHPWLVDLLLGIDRQLLHVEHNLSRYFSPNTHLSGEALALYVAGQSLPELGDAPRRASIGRDVLLEESTRQIRDDGGHAELSAHYHRYSTDFYLLALNVARMTNDPAASRFEASAHRQAHYLRTLADDNGRLPLIGDDDGGQLFPLCKRDPVDCRDTLASAAVLLGEPAIAVSSSPEETFWFCANHPEVETFTAAAEPWPSRVLSASGYCVSRNPSGDHLIFDCGPHGFLNGGHAHSDALAIVLSIAGRPLLIDPGTATYTMDPAVRDRFRSTAMHNTVVVNGQPQSEPRGPFHWRRTTDAEQLAWRSSAEGDYAEGRHTGYGAVTHVRRVMALHGTGWVVVDHLTGSGLVEAAAMWHVHPSWQVKPMGSGAVELIHTDGARTGLASSVELRTLRGNGLDAYAPVYGRVEPASCLAAVALGAAPMTVATFVAASAAWIPTRIRRTGEGEFLIETESGVLAVTSSPERPLSVHVNAGLASTLHS